MAAQALGPDGHTFFAFLQRAGPARERKMTAQALGPGDGLSHPEQDSQQRMMPETGTTAGAPRRAPGAPRVTTHQAGESMAVVARH